MTFYKNKTIWITGASSGIGKEMAIQLSKHAKQLILSSRNTAALNDVKDLCHSDSDIQIIAIDLEDHEGLAEVFKNHHSILKDVDILINNGGISQRSLAIDTDFSVYKKLIDVNYLGSLKLTLLMLPIFKQRNSGHLVVTSSVAGKFGVPLRTGYSASKFALHGFYEGLRAELSKTKINITMVCPGFIHTDISKNSLTGDGSLQGTMDQGQLNGMPVEQMVKKALKGTAQCRPEILVGGFKETRLAVFVSRLFPNLFRKIIARSSVT